jgi:hypothetical protein
MESATLMEHAHALQDGLMILVELKCAAKIVAAMAFAKKEFVYANQDGMVLYAVTVSSNKFTLFNALVVFCSGTTSYNDRSGVLTDHTSTSIQQYLKDTSCHFSIYPLPKPESGVTIIFRAFQLEANADFLTVTDGPSHSK